MNYCRYHCQILSVAQWFHTLHRSTWSGRGGRLLGVSEDDVFFCAIGQWLLHHLRAIYWIVFNLLIYRYNIYIIIIVMLFIHRWCPEASLSIVYIHILLLLQAIAQMYLLCIRYVGSRLKPQYIVVPWNHVFFSPYYFNQRFFTHFVNLA